MHRTKKISAVAATAVTAGALMTFTWNSAATANTSHQQQAKPGSAAAGPMFASNMNNRCLEVREGNTGNGAMIDIWDCSGHLSERWVWSGNGEIRNELSQKCLDIVASNHENGAGVDLFDCRGWPAQQWRWDGTQIRSNMSNRCLEISGGNWYMGATVQMWDCNGGSHQQWHLS
ncbi:RICIN domain-containing protein [Actinomadura litoris]|uniref:RICIN domain-containing protein n=1 Tax=Actinomadura litoris TaxID=2678616 RepID=UPI001FA7DB37|nr:lectin [Actinomadura litoris]